MNNKPNWQKKCLMVIEAVAENNCDWKAHKENRKCFACEIFVLAHAGTGDCPHPTWNDKVKKLWKEFNNE